MTRPATPALSAPPIRDPAPTRCPSGRDLLDELLREEEARRAFGRDPDPPTEPEPIRPVEPISEGTLALAIGLASVFWLGFVGLGVAVGSALAGG